MRRVIWWQTRRDEKSEVIWSIMRKNSRLNRNFEPPIPAAIVGHSWINLGNGKFAKVDLEDYERVSKWSWSLNDMGYARARILRRTAKLHRFIMRAPKGVSVDHINLDPLDNRKANLRFATQQQNTFNQPKRKTNASGFKGVSWHSQNKNWRATIWLNGKQISLGSYDSPEEAAKAYDRKALELFGDFALTNQALRKLRPEPDKNAAQ